MIVDYFINNESIAKVRTSLAKTKHLLILWLAFALKGLFLLITFGWRGLRLNCYKYKHGYYDR